MRKYIFCTKRIALRIRLDGYAKCGANNNYSFYIADLVTSTQPSALERARSSSMLSFTALLLLPAAGKTTSNLFNDWSRYTLTPSFAQKGQTPPKRLG